MGVSIFATLKSIFGYYVAPLGSLDSVHQLMKSGCNVKATRKVNTMLLILSLYSSLLALAIWQQDQCESAES